MRQKKIDFQQCTNGFLRCGRICRDAVNGGWFTALRSSPKPSTATTCGFTDERLSTPWASDCWMPTARLDNRTIFGRKVTKHDRGERKTVIEELDLPNPVIRSYCGNGFIKQNVRDHVDLRTEPASDLDRLFAKVGLKMAA